MSGIFYLGNDNLLRGTGLYTISLVTGLPVYLDATVTASVTLYDAEDVEIEGEDWPVSFAYIAGSQGNFLAVLRDTLAVATQDQVKAHVIFNNGMDQLGTWDGVIYVQERSF